jgi:hypothetical protein
VLKAIGISFIILILCITGFYFYYHNALSPIGLGIAQRNEVFYISGFVSHKKKVDGQWSILVVDSDISNGDSIKTSKSSGVDIKFGKDMNNIVSASEYTSLEFSKISRPGDKAIKLHKGTLLSDLKDIDSGSRFEVITPTAVCGVLGTSFETQAIDGKTYLKVYEGTVYAKGTGMQSIFGKEVLVRGGTQTVIEKSCAPKEPIPISENDMARWMQWKGDLPYRMFRTFYVFSDEDDTRNHYYPSGWLGDYDAIRRVIWEENPNSGKNCLRFRYTGRTPQGAGWVGVYWQNPVNNWGDIEGGFDLVGAKRLSFSARGEKGGETVLRFGMGGIGGQYPDSAKAEIGPIVLTSNWMQYTIDLADKDLSYVSGGFYWMMDKNTNPDGAVIYLDDIRYE